MHSGDGLLIIMCAVMSLVGMQDGLRSMGSKGTLSDHLPSVAAGGLQEGRPSNVTSLSFRQRLFQVKERAKDVKPWVLGLGMCQTWGL